MDLLLLLLLLDWSLQVLDWFLRVRVGVEHLLKARCRVRLYVMLRSKVMDQSEEGYDRCEVAYVSGLLLSFLLRHTVSLSFFWTG